MIEQIMCFITTHVSEISAVATGFSAIGTFILAWLTWTMVKEMKSSREEEVRPYVVAYIKFQEDRAYFICKNIGKSTAENVKLYFDRPLKGCNNFDITTMVFNNIFPSMPPNYKIKTFVDSSYHIVKDNEDTNKNAIINIDIEYNNKKKLYKDKYIIDLGWSANIMYTRRVETKICSSLEEIAKGVKNIGKEDE